jgi:hypothetical protein
VCAFTSLEIAYNKITSFCEDGNPTPPDPEPPSQMQVRRRDWSIHAVDTTAPLEAVKYLGVYLPLHGQDVESYIRCYKYLAESRDRLISCRALPDCKLLVLEMQLVPGILNSSSKAAWTTPQYTQIDNLMAGEIFPP